MMHKEPRRAARTETSDAILILWEIFTPSPTWQIDIHDKQDYSRVAERTGYGYDHIAWRAYMRRVRRLIWYKEV